MTIGIFMMALFSGSAKAALTHYGKVDVDLVIVDSNGTESKIDSYKTDFHLDWRAGKCEIELSKNSFAYCSLEVSKDLNDSKGNLLVSAVPTAHFDGVQLDAIINLLGQGDKRTKGIISQILNSTSGSRSIGLDLPFYTCEKCKEGANGKTPVWNAYDSFVLRSVRIQHPLLQGKALVLKMKLHQMVAVKGAFSIIGDNSAGNFGTH